MIFFVVIASRQYGVSVRVVLCNCDGSCSGSFIFGIGIRHLIVFMRKFYILCYITNIPLALSGIVGQGGTRSRSRSGSLLRSEVWFSLAVADVICIYWQDQIVIVLT